MIRLAGEFFKSENSYYLCPHVKVSRSFGVLRSHWL